MRRLFFFSSIFLIFVPFFVFAASPVKENLVRLQPFIEVKDHVFGDVIAVGNTVTITGDVDGDVLALAATLTVRGKVSGNIRAVGATIIIEGEVGRNVTVAGGVVILGERANVGESVALVAENTEIRGTIANRLDARVKSISVTGTVRGPTVLYQRNDGEAREAQTSQYIFRRIISLFGLLVVGLVLISLLRSPTATVLRFVIERSWQSIAWGLVFLFTPPILSFLLALTVIGAPLAFLLFLLWIVFFYLAQVIVSLAIGVKLVLLLDRGQKITSLLWPLIFGVVLWVVLTSLPYVGWILWFVGIAWGLGALSDMSRRIVLELVSRK